MAKNESEKKALKAIDKAVKKAIKSQGKLERIVVGSDVSGRGKRTDALMKTKGQSNLSAS
jgi:hypothetical protein